MKKVYIGILYKDKYEKEHLVFTSEELKQIFDQNGKIYFKVYTTDEKLIYIDITSIKKLKTVEV